MYIYSGNEATADVEFDAHGDVPEPPTGSVMRRLGKQWKVESTSMTSEGAQPK